MLIIRSALVLIVALACAPVDAASLEGRARVVDGDTLHIGGERVRLFGIDAPEHDQTCGDGWACGDWATRALAGQVEGRTVICEGDSRDRYGRLIATCRAGGTDIGGAQVRAGAAIAYRRYSVRYLAEEADAAAAGLGMWSGRMVTPEAFRRGVADPAAPAGCAIKGNLSAKGRIYHLPGQPGYAATRISKPGEAWFCSEAEARAAGFRPIRR